MTTTFKEIYLHDYKMTFAISIGSHYALVLDIQDVVPCSIECEDEEALKVLSELSLKEACLKFKYTTLFDIEEEQDGKKPTVSGLPKTPGVYKCTVKVFLTKIYIDEKFRDDHSITRMEIHDLQPILGYDQFKCC